VFSTLPEWNFWNREQKRQLWTTLAPCIRVANYKVESLGLNPKLFSNEDSRRGRGSWRRHSETRVAVSCGRYSQVGATSREQRPADVLKRDISTLVSL